MNIKIFVFINIQFKKHNLCYLRKFVGFSYAHLSNDFSLFCNLMKTFIFYET